jgi:hypothetical protein
MIFWLFWAVALIIVAVVIYSEARKTKHNRPENGHCWHDPYSHLDHSYLVRCCYCGLDYDPSDLVVHPDHGPHAPKTCVPTPPTEPCPERVSLLSKAVSGAVRGVVYGSDS